MEQALETKTIGYLLHFASKGEVEAVKKVLNDNPGLSVDAHDYDGRTAMHLAASEGRSDVIKYLILQKRANVNPVDRWRKTPLADAKRYEAANAGTSKRSIYREVCDILVTNGGSTSSPFEIDPAELKYLEGIISKSKYGVIRLANWRGTNVQARIMDRKAEHSPKSDPQLTKQLSLLQRLRHPNIVQFLGAVQTKSQPLVLVTEYLPIGSLHDLLRDRKKGRISQKEAMSYALDIARGMNYLHQHKPEVVHCDLNPTNLLRDAGGHLKVAGLHLSKIACICHEGRPTSVGEPEFSRYKAPELTNQPAQTPKKRVDVYSFGVIVREMFEGRSLASRQAHGYHPQVIEAEEAAASRLYPPKMKTLLQKCCHPDPRNRWEFEKIIEHLEEINDRVLRNSWCGFAFTISASLSSCLPQPRRQHWSKSMVYSVEDSLKHLTGIGLHPTKVRITKSSTCPHRLHVDEQIKANVDKRRYRSR